MRYFSPEVRKIAHEGIRRHAQAIADAFELKAEVIIEESALSMYNDDELAKLAEQSAAKSLVKVKCILTRYMGSEDMPTISNMLKEFMHS